MSVKLKVFLLFLLFGVLTIFAVYLFGEFIIVDKLNVLDKNNAITKVEQIESIIFSDCETLSSNMNSSDQAEKIYNLFLKNAEEEAILNQICLAYNLNFFLFLDNANSSEFSYFFDSVLGRRVSFPSKLLKDVKNTIQSSEAKECVLEETSISPMLIFWLSFNQNQKKKILVFGKIVDEFSMSRYRETLSSEFEVIAQNALPKNVREKLKYSNTYVEITPNQKQQIVYKKLGTLNNSMILKSYLDRTNYLKGIAYIETFLFVLSLSCFIGFILLFLFLNKTIFSRINSFISQFQYFQESPEKLKEITVVGEDELSLLGTEANKLLANLYKINSEYEQKLKEQQKIDENLLIAKERAENADKLKAEFLALVSHEIRTPINTMLSFTSLIKEEIQDSVDDDLKECFSGISHAGKRIIRTIDLILNMSEIQMGIYDSRPRALNIYSSILEQVYMEHCIAATDKGIKLVLLKNIEEPYVKADEYSVTQIVKNLVDNAIKYTHEGEVKIICDKDKNSRVVVQIVDTGIGISKDYMEKMFEPFSQEEHGYTRPYEGNGLGLSLVKNYCNINGIKINVDSKKGEGSKFTIIFPKTDINL